MSKVTIRQFLKIATTTNRANTQGGGGGGLTNEDLVEYNRELKKFNLDKPVKTTGKLLTRSSQWRYYLENAWTKLDLRTSILKPELQRSMKDAGIDIPDSELDRAIRLVQSEAKKWASRSGSKKDENTFWVEEQKSIYFSGFGTKTPKAGQDPRNTSKDFITYLKRNRVDETLDKILFQDDRNPRQDRGHDVSVAALVNSSNVFHIINAEGVSSNIRNKFIKLSNEILQEASKDTLSVEREDVFNPKSKEWVTSYKIITLQHKKSNNEQSSGETQYADRLKALLLQAHREILSSGISEDALVNLRGSPSSTELLLDGIEDIVLGNRQRNKSRKVKAKQKLNFANEIRNKSSTKGQAFSFKIRKDGTLNITSILRNINLRLHDEIESNMGDSTDPPTKLRYQTGRFALSAKATMAIQRQNALQVFYSYQNNPYDVFAPGGELHSPARNPKAIIGKSVRDIATRLIQAKLRVIASEAI
jgi:hypothetical protein